MAEIKMNASEIERIFNELKVKVETLDSTPLEVVYQTTKLDSANLMKEIETDYYKILKLYQDTVVQIEKELQVKIKEYFELDEQISNKMLTK